MLREVRGQPDILEVISNLSSDEVNTPPKVANAVLDLLPPEVWTNPDLRWIDPGTKTGVFLREATKRLMTGLQEAIPDESERLEHILKNMMHGIAITELTALMSRRTLYCSKDASGPKSEVQMPTPAGNIWMERVEHEYVRGKCQVCGASETQMEGDHRENHAYAFIHPTGQEALTKAWSSMNFDVIVGNPPYQMDGDGGSRTVPLYNLFVDQAKSLSPKYIAMIVPSRWMAGGLGLSNFRQEMLTDGHIRKLVDFSRMEKVFPGVVDFEGGVCYFLWDRDNPGPCEVTFFADDEAIGPVQRQLDEFDIFIRDVRALAILKKVAAHNEPSITDILAVDKEFGMTSNYAGVRLHKGPKDIAVHHVRNNKRRIGGMRRADIPKSRHLIDTWKVLIPKAYGERGAIPAHVLGPMYVAAPPSACTQTFLFVYLDSEGAANSAMSYLRTRFARFLISLRKITQDATRATYTWVPQQTWDREWTEAELYEKYGLTEEEQDYIAAMVREVTT